MTVCKMNRVRITGVLHDKLEKAVLHFDAEHHQLVGSMQKRHQFAQQCRRLTQPGSAAEESPDNAAENIGCDHGRCR